LITRELLEDLFLLLNFEITYVLSLILILTTQNCNSNVSYEMKIVLKITASAHQTVRDSYPSHGFPTKFYLFGYLNEPPCLLKLEFLQTGTIFRKFLANIFFLKSETRCI